MPKLPNKSIKGANFKKWCIESIDTIIDYLSSALYLNPGNGISIERRPSGIIIGLEKHAPQPTSAVSGGTAAYSGLTATVSGGTATVDVSGVNPLELVAGANVNITGGTNGEVIVSATGGTGSVGFPDYMNPLVSHSNVQIDHTYTYASPVWVIGTIEANADINGQTRAATSIYLSSGTNSKSVYLFDASSDSSDVARLSTQVSLPIPANVSFEFQDVNYPGDDSILSGLEIYPCI